MLEDFGEGSTSGVVGGVEIGGGDDLDWSTIRGEGTLYQGQVAEIAPTTLSRRVMPSDCLRTTTCLTMPTHCHSMF